MPGHRLTSVAPKRLLYGAGVAVVVGGVLLATHALILHVVGYLLGSVVTIGLLIAYVRVDAARRNRPGYRALHERAARGPLRGAAGAAVAAGHAWILATRVAG